VGLWLELPRYGRVSSFRIYERGISVGYGARPYRRRGDVFSLEEAPLAIGRLPLAVVTFTDGSSVRISQGRLWEPYIWLQKQYPTAMAILRSTLADQTVERMIWEPEADDLVQRRLPIVGPARAGLEALARQEGLAQVSTEFVQSNWEAISDARSVGTNSFLASLVRPLKTASKTTKRADERP
jgi:hypothetical protein